MRKPIQNIQIFARRRQKLAPQLMGNALILTSYPETTKSHDLTHLYRQDSNLYYLTGFEEPETIFIYRPGRTPETVLFVRKKDRERETWDGFRFGPEGAQQEFGIEKAYLLEDFHKVAPQLLKEVEGLYYTLYKNPEYDRWIEEALKGTKTLLGRSGSGFLPVMDASYLLGEQRVIKSEDEIELMREACRISGLAHIEAMKFTKPGVTERQVQGLLYYKFLQENATREAYNFIVASGNQATTLHYNFNDQVCRNGELLLIDAGAEYMYYNGDITRTFPVNGKFTDEQAIVYEAVLKVQKALIEMVKPGIPFQQFHDQCTSLLTDVMLDLGLLQGTKESVISALEYKKYYPHGVGHYLGMDVHDVGSYMKDKKPRALEENMVFTIEPGIYLPADDRNVPEKFRGIGVRIEDNIRVTLNGYENMTSQVPKEISDLERIVGRA